MFVEEIVSSILKSAEQWLAPELERRAKKLIAQTKAWSAPCCPSNPVKRGVTHEKRYQSWRYMKNQSNYFFET